VRKAQVDSADGKHGRTESICSGVDTADQ
jgi:hypothetical protein